MRQPFVADPDQGRKDAVAPSPANPSKSHAQTPAKEQEGKRSLKSSRGTTGSRRNAAKKVVQGARRCHYFDSSLGCLSGDSCRFKQICVVCGEPRDMIGNH